MYACKNSPALDPRKFEEWQFSGAVVGNPAVNFLILGCVHGYLTAQPNSMTGYTSW